MEIITEKEKTLPFIYWLKKRKLGELFGYFISGVILSFFLFGFRSDNSIKLSKANPLGYLFLLALGGVGMGFMNAYHAYEWEKKKRMTEGKNEIGKFRFAPSKGFKIILSGVFVAFGLIVLMYLVGSYVGRYFL